MNKVAYINRSKENHIHTILLYHAESPNLMKCNILGRAYQNYFIVTHFHAPLNAKERAALAVYSVTIQGNFTKLGVVVHLG